MAAARIRSVVSAQWLRTQLTNKMQTNFRVLDTTWGLTQSGHDAYAKEHIPGALFFDLNRCVNPRALLPRYIPNPVCFSAYCHTLGISRDTHLVCYDRGVMLAAARTWWNFKAYGHEQVSVLDGGLTAWKADGNPVEDGLMSLPEQTNDFEVSMQSHLLAEFEAVVEASRKREGQIVDARSPANFRGDNAEPSGSTQKAFSGVDLALPGKEMQAGRIPGSVNLPEDLVINQETKCLLNTEQLKEAFQTAGVDLSKSLTTTCYNGNAACLLALAAEKCGQPNTAVYYGSWTEYGYRASPEDVEKGQSSKHGKGVAERVRG